MTRDPAAPTASNAPACDIALAARLFDELAERTPGHPGITRASYGPGEAIAHEILRREADALGLTVETDAALNMTVTLPGARDLPPIVIGSHLDSVPSGGNFDGAAGVLMGLAVQAGLKRAAFVPDRPITVVAIRAEETAWFNTSYVGSRAATGQLTAEDLADVVRSDNGITLGEAIDAGGGSSVRVAAGERLFTPEGVFCFVEPHIEQGPVLLAEHLPLGLVTGIRGSFRHRQAECRGAYAHSGATPRQNRRDAVCAVATLVVELDALWQRLEAEGHDLVLTVGQFGVDPNEASFSKVAGHVSFSLDVRSRSPETLARVEAELGSRVAAIEAAFGVTFDLGPRTGSRPATMSEPLREAFAAAARAAGVPARTMASGAGHDAATFAALGIPTAMLFIRNANGSHNPDEQMDIADFAAVADVLMRFCANPPATLE